MPFLLSFGKDQEGDASFLARARPLIGEEAISVGWAGGDIATRHLDGRDADDPLNYPRARYLSQQFVEELCSANGMTDALLREIERVIFEAPSYATREGAVDFAELREGRTRLHSLARAREVEAIAAMSERIGLEHEGKLKGAHEALILQKTSLIQAYSTDRAKLVAKDSEAKVARHTELFGAAEALRTRNRQLVAQRQAFLALQSEVGAMRATKPPKRSGP